MSAVILLTGCLALGTVFSLFLLTLLVRSRARWWDDFLFYLDVFMAQETRKSPERPLPKNIVKEEYWPESNVWVIWSRDDGSEGR